MLLSSLLLLVGCAGTHPGATLTAPAARLAAIRLANDQAFTVYHCQPFQAGPAAQFVNGRWLWVRSQGFGLGDIQATVELAADGSTNQVKLQLFDSRDQLSMRQGW